MRTYHPSGFLPPFGALLLLIAVVAGGVALGVLTYFVSKLIYLVIIFPLLMGGLGGAVLAAAVSSGKVRSPLAAGFCGILMALTLYGSFRYAEYWFGFRKDLRNEVEKSYGQKISDAEYKFMEESFLLDHTGSKGFIGYTKLEAKSGVTLTDVGATSSSGKMTLKGVIAYGYWVIEILLIGVGTVLIALYQARRPFSEETNEWYGKPAYLATVPPDAINTTLALLRQADFARTRRIIAIEPQPPKTVPRTEIVVRRTSSPLADVILGVRWTYHDGRKNIQTKMLLEGLASAAAVQALTGPLPFQSDAPG